MFSHPVVYNNSEYGIASVVVLLSCTVEVEEDDVTVSVGLSTKPVSVTCAAGPEVPAMTKSALMDCRGKP